VGEGDRGTLFAAVGMEFEAVADTPLLYDDWKSYVEEAAGSLKEMGPSFARTPLFFVVVGSTVLTQYSKKYRFWYFFFALVHRSQFPTDLHK
jgi:hypothetical protein